VHCVLSTENKRATAVITRRRMIMEAKEYDVVITKLTNYTLVVSQALELRGSFVVVCVVILWVFSVVDLSKFFSCSRW
jgi:hypothetical protein